MIRIVHRAGGTPKYIPLVEISISQLLPGVHPVILRQCSLVEKHFVGGGYMVNSMPPEQAVQRLLDGYQAQQLPYTGPF